MKKPYRYEEVMEYIRSEKISHDEMATRIGVKPATFSNWYNVDSKNQHGISKKNRVHLDFLLDGNKKLSIKCNLTDQSLCPFGPDDFQRKELFAKIANFNEKEIGWVLQVIYQIRDGTYKDDDDQQKTREPERAGAGKTA